MTSIAYPIASPSLFSCLVYFLTRGDVRSIVAMLTSWGVCLFHLRMTVLRMNFYLLALIDGETQF